MHYNLLFNGCSFTFGAELERFGGREHLKSHRFSSLVSNHFNKTHDNIAIGGSSNDAIVERTIDWFRKGNTCDLAVIQFTFRERQLYYDYDETSYEQEFFILPSGSVFNTGMDFKHNSFLNPHIHLDKHKAKIKIKVNKYYSSFYSKELGNQNLHKNIFFLKTYFESHKIKYFFISLPPVEYCITDSYKHNLKLFSIIDYGKGNSILGKIIRSENFCKPAIINNSMGKKTRFGGTHPSEIGHQKIANYIIGEISDAL